MKITSAYLIHIAPGPGFEPGNCPTLIILGQEANLKISALRNSIAIESIKEKIGDLLEDLVNRGFQPTRVCLYDSDGSVISRLCQAHDRIQIMTRQIKTPVQA